MSSDHKPQFSKVRSRFAPSPTGFMHVGSVRTALFAWLVARQAGGQFILRIEDTDKSREVTGSINHIESSLRWLGLDWDEGPFIQSQRLDIYKQWAEKLIAEGRAYADKNTPEDLEKLRVKAKEQKRPFLFRDFRPQNPPVWNGKMPLRFKSEPKTYQWKDEVFGELSTGPEVIDDFIIIKSDGFPTYNFAHIIDDHLMKISHVIRSQEFLASVPKFLNLYEALEIKRPKLATLPYVLGPDGKKKLSKRDGAKDVLDYKNEGYLPEAMNNFLATLGWNDGTEQEIFTIHELIDKFSLKRVHRSGAKFDEKRLLWINGQHIRRLSNESLYELAEGFWNVKISDKDLKKRVLEVTEERLHRLSDLPAITAFFFKPSKKPTEISTAIKELFRTSKEINLTPGDWLNKVLDLLSQTEVKTKNSFETPLRALAEATSNQRAILYGSLREALTGAEQTPPVWEIIYALGKNEANNRLETALKNLEK